MQFVDIEGNLGINEKMLLYRGKTMVREGGLEPPFPEENQILSLARLPIPPLSHIDYLTFYSLISFIIENNLCKKSHH